VRKDGSQFWASIVSTAIYDEDGRLQGFGKVTRDLTERHALEKENLRRSLHDHLTGLPTERCSGTGSSAAGPCWPCSSST
jgi:hypothetical protein